MSEEAEEAAGLSEVFSSVTMETYKDMVDAVDMTNTSSCIGPQNPRPPSPVPSCVSLRSDKSMPIGPDFTNEAAPSGLKPQITRLPFPVPSCVSLKSDRSMPIGPDFSSEPAVIPQIPRPPSPVPSCVSLKSDRSMPIGPDLTNEQDPSAVKMLKSLDPQPPLDDDGHTDMAESSRHLQTEHTPHTRRTQDDVVLRRVIENHKARLKKRFDKISEGIIKPGAETLLNEIYTDIYITEGESEGVNKEHEVWQVESAFRPETTEDTPINCNDIFKPLPGQDKSIRTVMTKGVAGIGKTVSVQKFILDWTNGVANQNVDFMFPLPFRELNLVRNDQYSLHKLLLEFHAELKELKDGEEYKDCQVVFIFDGLDESRLTLNFQQMMFSDVKQTSSVNVLITNLFQGTLFPSALIWITSRPSAASQIPAQYIDRVTEVRGFNDPQKEEYLRKRISDESQANRIISHVKASRSLYIMCHIPVFCWIAATVLKQLLKRDNSQEIPKTLTGMFIHFLLLQTTRKDQKYHKIHETDVRRLLESQRNILLKLAELAFKNLENRNLMFYEEELRDCGIDISEASVYSGMCTEIFKAESVLHQKKVYCFLHLTIQEFLAALFVFHSYVNKNLDPLMSLISEEHKSFLSSLQSALGRNAQIDVLLKSTVDRSVASRNGQLDLFLRFLMGISLESSQTLLQGLLNKMHNTSKSIEDTCQYIKELNKEDLSPERCINLFYCLFELNDHSMHEEIQKFLSSPKNMEQKLSPAHCSALAQTLLMSEEVLDEFDLKKYNTSDEGRRRLVPAVRSCRKARLADCKLTEKSYRTVASVLQSPSSLIELDLSTNDLGDSGVKLLSKGLSSPHCKLQTLRLVDCQLTGKFCEILASVLQSPNSLIELDLSTNDLGDSGVQLLCKGLSSPHCKLQTLRFVDCQLTDEFFEKVASVLQSPNSLKELDLSYNHLGDSGVQLLCKGLSCPNCKLQTLRLSDCLISEKGCVCVASTLTSNHSHLEELDLSYNYPGELGLELLSARLKDPACKLELLKTDHASLNRARPRLLRYACKLRLDPNTAHRLLSLADKNRKLTWVYDMQPYPDHPERFDKYSEVLCRQGLFGRCYWEAEWSGLEAHITVAYKSIKRKGNDDDIIMGWNAKSWSLSCSSDSYFASHKKKHTAIPVPSSCSRRVGVYLDWPAGTLSFYSVSSDTLTHLHTFRSTFTEPLYPGFRLDWLSNSSVTLCQIT